jgi:hypothetical protein
VCPGSSEILQPRAGCQCVGYRRNFEMPAKKQTENRHAMSPRTQQPWGIIASETWQLRLSLRGTEHVGPTAVALILLSEQEPMNPSLGLT